MDIGVVKEIKQQEYRVSITPDGVASLVTAGHKVLVEQGAGMGSGFIDEQYRQAGATLVLTDRAWSNELVVKVKEPLESEYRHFNGQMVFTFFHLAGAKPSLIENLLHRKMTAIAYETLEDEQGRLPLLMPMSAVAGNMATLMGSFYLAKFNGGKGMQLGIVNGTTFGKVVIIGDGVVGQHAATVAIGMGSSVVMFGLNQKKYQQKQCQNQKHQNYTYFLSTPESIEREIVNADLVVGAVLRHGGKAPFVVTEAMVKKMTPGAVIVDVSIDQGGCIETSRPTSHQDPIYTLHNVVHYCVANMPGAYPRTSTLALTQQTLLYIQMLAEQGLTSMLKKPGLSKAINTYGGFVTNSDVARSLCLSHRFKRVAELIASVG
ncbi:MAG: alanine dehydrogenase [Methylococcaceae bacterium]